MMTRNLKWERNIYLNYEFTVWILILRERSIVQIYGLEKRLENKSELHIARHNLFKEQN